MAAAGFCDQPPAEVAGLLAELDGDQELAARIVAVGCGVLLVVNLLHGLLGTAVQLELEDVNMTGSLDHRVDAPQAGLDHRVDHRPDQLEHGEKNGTDGHFDAVTP